MGLGGNFNLPKSLKEFPKTAQEPSAPPDQIQMSSDFAQLRQKLQTTRSVTPGEGKPSSNQIKQLTDQLPLALLLLIVLLLFGFLFFYLWLSAHFNFVLLDRLTHRQIQFKESFQKNRPLGNSYFKWSLGFVLVNFIGFAFLVGLFALSAVFARPLLWLPFLLLVFFFLAMVLISILITDFVLPMMYRDNLFTLKGLRKLISVRPAVSSIALYVFLKIALWFFSGVLVTLLSALIAAIVLTLGFVTALAGGVLGGVLFIVCLSGLILLSGLATLPIAVFLRYFALFYLLRIDLDYNLIGFSDRFSADRSA